MHTRLRAPEYVGIARKINLLSPIVNHRWDGLGQGQGQSEQNIFCNRNGCDVCRPVGRVTLTAYFQWSRPKSKERTEKKKKKLKTLISSRFFFISEWQVAPVTRLNVQNVPPERSTITRRGNKKKKYDTSKSYFWNWCRTEITRRHKFYS